MLVLCLLAMSCEGEERPAATVSPGTVTAAKIAFAANLTGEETPFEGGTMPNSEIYLVDADGSNLTRLTNDPGADGNPAWSPDGTRIAFNRASVDGTEGGKTFIYVMNANGTGEARLAEGGLPTWSPDGNRIALIAGQESEWDVYVMNADGSGQTKLTAGDGMNVFGELMVGFKPNPWSPDGKKILFISSAGTTGSEEKMYQLYVIGADGSGEKLLLELPGQNPQGFPAWSPDGSRIAYTADRGGKDAIYVMNADGSGATPVTSGAGEGCDGLYGTFWSPDGRQLAFARGCWDGDAEVWVVNADGTGERHIAGTAGARPTRAALNPAWSPQ